MQSTDCELEKLLAAFAEAWNCHDVDLLMSMMADDGVFEASGGSHVNGERHEAQQAVRAAYAVVFAQYPDAHWGQCPAPRKGDRGVSERTFTGTLKDGKWVEVTGCDLFTFRIGTFAVNNSFRKKESPPHNAEKLRPPTMGRRNRRRDNQYHGSTPPTYRRYTPLRAASPTACYA